MAEAAARVLTAGRARPRVAVIAGSGLAPALGALETDMEIPYAELAGFPVPTVSGHVGALRLGRFAGLEVAVFLGRFHYYEGHPMPVVALPVRLAAALGAEAVALTASVGALRADLRSGDLVVAEDHINLMGENPLRGWKGDDGQPPFVDLSRLYDERWRRRTLEEAHEAGARVTSGIYLAVSGPSYETPAEVAFMRHAGGTVVGMSVVPEALAAAALGMKVLGLFCVTNALADELSHGEVVRTAERSSEMMATVLERSIDGGLSDT